MSRIIRFIDEQTRQPRAPRGLPPDIDYFIDCSLTFGHLGLDAAFFMRFIHPDPARFIDELPTERSPNPLHNGFKSHCHSLAASCFHLETEYLRWRRANPELALLASMSVVDDFATIVESFTNDLTLDLVNAGYEALTYPALRWLTYKRNLDHFIGVTRRSLRRAESDFRRVVNEGGLNEVQLKVLRSAFLRLTTLDVGRCRPLPPQITKRDRKKRRAILKRSINFLSSLVGAPTTRLFLNGQSLRVEGRDFDYVIKHLGSLEIVTKAGEHISNVCIHTPGVPLLDHVASLVLHIKAGAEQEIIKAGNLHGINRDLALSIPALAPKVPEPTDITVRPSVINPQISHHERDMAKRAIQGPMKKLVWARLAVPEAFVDLSRRLDRPRPGFQVGHVTLIEALYRVDG